jgi:hypothetical protein
MFQEAICQNEIIAFASKLLLHNKFPHERQIQQFIAVNQL